MADELLIKTPSILDDSNSKYACCPKNHVHPIIRYANDINEYDPIQWPSEILSSSVVSKEDIRASQLLQLHVDRCPHERVCSTPNNTDDDFTRFVLTRQQSAPLAPRKTSDTRPVTPTGHQLRKRNTVAASHDDILQMKEQLRKINEDLDDLKESVEELRDEVREQTNKHANQQSLKPVLKRVTFLENAYTLDELIKFKLGCKNRVYDVIYNARGARTVVSPAYVDDENKVEKLAVRERVRIYIPGKAQALQVVSEIASVVFNASMCTFTMEAVLHRERNMPAILGKDFGQLFIVGVNVEHKIITLKDDSGLPAAISFEFYNEP